MPSIGAFLLMIGLASPVMALDLKTDDFAIRLPETWSCDPDQAVFICTDSNAQKSAIVLINYSEASPADTMEQFTDRLRSPRMQKTASGQQIVSRVVSYQERQIGDQNWIESIHFEGEMADYYTYYLATLRPPKAFLITLSAHKDDWDKYRPIFENIISSISVFSQSQIATSDSQMQIQQNENDNVVAPTNDSPNDLVSEPMRVSHIFLIGAIVTFGFVALYALRS